MTDYCTDHADRDLRPGGVLDLLLEQYENSEDDNSFLDNLLFHQMYQELRAVDPELSDRIIALACALCGEHSRAGYIAGVQDGARLIMDLRS